MFRLYKIDNLLTLALKIKLQNILFYLPVVYLNNANF